MAVGQAQLIPAIPLFTAVLVGTLRLRGTSSVLYKRYTV
jgi:hypothetical protein